MVDIGQRRPSTGIPSADPTAGTVVEDTTVARPTRVRRTQAVAAGSMAAAVDSTAAVAAGPMAAEATADIANDR